ncbi:MAG TPA: hypothetical protein VF607_05295, partial [Verrucomicrobiae bacterium]
MMPRLSVNGDHSTGGPTNSQSATFLIPSRKYANWCWLLLALGLLLTVIGCRHSDYAQAVELVVGSDPLTPGSTFELRFTEPMVAESLVGTAAAESPLIIKPPVAGTFTWLSTRSGVFTPGEPLKLAT